MIGQDVSSWTFISPWDTASAMYSKCIVWPLISTPMAIMASNAPPVVVPSVLSVPEPLPLLVKSLVEADDRRSVAADTSWVEVEVVEAACIR